MAEGRTRLEERPRTLSLDRCQVRVVKGPDKGKRAVLSGDRLRIGRDDPNDLPLADELASRLHAEISATPEGFQIVDLQSRNGTYLGDHRIMIAFLEEGDRLRIGANTLVFERDGATIELPLSDRARFGTLLGETVAMRRIIDVLDRAARTDVTILLRGETGTGKEEAARSVHQNSKRAGAPFVVLDCGAVPGTLLGSELFGHEKGAFTGANETRKGALERAHGGTLFLDELGELAFDLQPQLLRVLERREVQRLGGNKTIDADVRLIAATNRDLRQEVNAGRFRADLYFRLAVVDVVLPPLRDRLDDLPLLARHLFDELSARTDTQAPPLTRAELAQLSGHYWPGNVRELRNFIERRVLLGAGLDVESVAVFGAANDAAALLPYRESKAAIVDRFERDYVDALLRRTEGNISKAAREAKMDRSYLLELMKKHGRSLRG